MIGSPAGFVFRGSRQHVLFGSGSSRGLTDGLTALGLSAPFLITTSGQARRLGPSFDSIGFAGRYENAQTHTPVGVTQEALANLEQANADVLVSVGGGSATGLGKALAFRTRLPLVAIGTTYGGSEMTDLLGQSEGGVKSTLRDSAVMPALTIYDVELTLGLPVPVSLASGLNALAHAVEAVYSSGRNPIVTAVAADAIAGLVRALPVILDQPTDTEARTLALSSACSAGFALNAVSMGLHHKLCHTLGGMFNLNHAQMHGLLLPYAMAYNRPSIHEAMAIFSSVMGTEDPIGHIHSLSQRLPGLSGLCDLGMPETGIAEAVAAVMANPYPNPEPLEPGALTKMLTRAWSGAAP